MKQIAEDPWCANQCYCLLQLALTMRHPTSTWTWCVSVSKSSFPTPQERSQGSCHPWPHCPSMTKVSHFEFFPVHLALSLTGFFCVVLAGTVELVYRNLLRDGSFFMERGIGQKNILGGAFKVAGGLYREGVGRAGSTVYSVLWKNPNLSLFDCIIIRLCRHSDHEPVTSPVLVKSIS